MAMADAAIAGARARRATGPDPEKRAPLQSRRADAAVDPNDPATWGRVSRNALCPCGSGKKYKHCHGKMD
jgi:preprotein translocase subunit SecA